MIKRTSLSKRTKVIGTISIGLGLATIGSILKDQQNEIDELNTITDDLLIMLNNSSQYQSILESIIGKSVI